ncbi:hypothetical protein BV25DRAFT_1835942 [Artomyces pyxidatus]|uniref:Uncharacterized protein n=1 Tax=Artomyces pyxidatus TaxID=48021 RepID=A0ACB8TCY1_9AGAM|nr:hypothetical protein BV25DRAFT_1835942 [Artomyces pyxidatus]
MSSCLRWLRIRLSYPAQLSSSSIQLRRPGYVQANSLENLLDKANDYLDGHVLVNNTMPSSYAYSHNTFWKDISDLFLRSPSIADSGVDAKFLVFRSREGKGNERELLKLWGSCDSAIAFHTKTTRCRNGSKSHMAIHTPSDLHSSHWYLPLLVMDHKIDTFDLKQKSPSHLPSLIWVAEYLEPLEIYDFPIVGICTANHCFNLYCAYSRRGTQGFKIHTYFSAICETFSLGNLSRE